MQLRANHPARARRYRNTARTSLTREREREIQRDREKEEKEEERERERRKKRRRKGRKYLRAPGYGERSVK